MSKCTTTKTTKTSSDGGWGVNLTFFFCTIILLLKNKPTRVFWVHYFSFLWLTFWRFLTSQVILAANVPFTETAGGVIFTSMDAGKTFRSVQLPFHPAQAIQFHYQDPKYLVTISIDVRVLFSHLWALPTPLHDKFITYSMWFYYMMLIFRMGYGSRKTMGTLGPKFTKEFKLSHGENTAEIWISFNKMKISEKHDWRVCL